MHFAVLWYICTGRFGSLVPGQNGLFVGLRTPICTLEKQALTSVGLVRRDLAWIRPRVMRIVIASEESSTRAAIGMLIAAQPDFELAGEVADITDLLFSVKTQRPDLVALDWDVLGKRIETLQALLELFDEPPLIIALSVHEEARNAALDSGIAGFAYKGAPPSQLLKTIREARRMR